MIFNHAPRVLGQLQLHLQPFVAWFTPPMWFLLCQNILAWRMWIIYGFSLGIFLSENFEMHFCVCQNVAILAIIANSNLRHGLEWGSFTYLRCETPHGLQFRLHKRLLLVVYLFIFHNVLLEKTYDVPSQFQDLNPGSLDSATKIIPLYNLYCNILICTIFQCINW